MAHYTRMSFYRRHPPHLDEPGKPVFLTGPSHDSLRPNRAFPSGPVTSGQAFALMDRRLDETLVMPNRLRVLVTLAVSLPTLTKSLKDINAKLANLMLGPTGKSLWQKEGYDHLARYEQEFEKIRNYNGVRPGVRPA